MSRIDELASNHKRVKVRKKNIKRHIRELNQKQKKDRQRKVFSCKKSINDLFRECLKEYLEQEVEDE